MKYHHFVELASAVIGIMLVKKHWPVYAKLLVILAGVTFIIEISSQLLWENYKYSCHWLYNLFLPFQCFVILFVHFKMLLYPKTRKAVFYLLCMLGVGTVFSYFFHQSFTIFNHYASTFQVVLMLIASGLFYLDISLNDNNTRLVNQPLFWLSTGILFFSSIFVIKLAIWDYIYTLPDFRVISNVTNIVGNTFFYGSLIIYFVCLRINLNLRLSR
jgi:hypothetical protein